MAHSLASKHEQAVRIALSDGSLEGNLTIPEAAHAVVLFAHGSGSSRFSPRNRFVADVLHEAGLATLLVDLLTPREDRDDFTTAQFRFNIPLLAGRLVKASDWLAEPPTTRELPIAYFGASTGAAAALVAAAGRPHIAAVVSRGGRPDLAGGALREVRAAVLLIVGGHDLPVLDLNEEAYEKLSKSREKQLQVVPGATHLFEEPGALDEVARLAADWFTEHFSELTPRPGDRLR
jgi:dienelactone hydrolase